MLSPWFNTPTFIMLIMFTAGLMSFASNWNHILSTLVALEFIALALFFMLSLLSPSLSTEKFSALFYLTLAVCEGALGLSILVLYARSKGNDILMLKNSLQW